MKQAPKFLPRNLLTLPLVIPIHGIGTFSRANLGSARQAISSGEADGLSGVQARSLGSLISTSASAGFLLLNSRGFAARLFRPLFRLVRTGWHIWLLGFIFGLGFDTATEVALLGISGTQGAQGSSVWVILLFPALFAAGMALVDTTDGILMLGAYEWAFVKPMRKLFYNMAITLVSVAVAVGIGGIEALGLLESRLHLRGGFWESVAALNGNFNWLGFLIIGIFIVAWVTSVLIYRYKGFDEVEVVQVGAQRSR